MFIALLLVIDLSTTYGEGPGEAMVPMFEGAAQIAAVVVYILALLMYPFLPDMPSWIVSVIAFAAASFTAGGIAVSLVILPLLSGFVAVLYIAPAGLILMLSAIDLYSEIRERSQTG